MDRTEALIELVKLTTAVVELRRDTMAGDLRRAVSKAVAVNQYATTIRDVERALVPMFADQIKSMSKRLLEVGGKALSMASEVGGECLQSDNPKPRKDASDEAHTLAALIFDPDEWLPVLIDRALPVFAVQMAKAADVQLRMMAGDLGRKSFQKTSRLEVGNTTTASQWLEDHPEDVEALEEMLVAQGMPIGIMTDLPLHMQQSIADNLANTFKQPYWSKVAATTQGDAETYLKQGLSEGWSIHKMGMSMRQHFSGGTERYVRMRAECIARTESGNALNGARTGAIEGLRDELPNEVSDCMKREWISVLGNTTRDAHADLDGVPEDENGEWTLEGIQCRWPSDVSLDVGNRANCQCTVGVAYGLAEDEARQLLDDYAGRVEARAVGDVASISGDGRTIEEYTNVSKSMEQYGRDLEKEAQEDLVLENAVKGYTFSGYRRINPVLREGDKFEGYMAEWVDKLDTITKRKLPGQTITYRGVGSSGEQIVRDMKRMLQEGGVVLDKAFVSTTLDAKAAASFIDLDIPVLLQINSKRGAYLELVSAERGKGEFEVLLPRNTEFKVLGIDEKVKVAGLTGELKNRDFTIIRLEAL